MRVLLITDSPEPSGVGRHMLTLAAALARKGVTAMLAFPGHPAGTLLTAEADAAGLDARVYEDAEAGMLMDRLRPDLVHLHAGIGWEGHGLTDAAGARGLTVVRTEHLPWLLTDPAQIARYAKATGQVHAVIAVSRAAAAGWRRALAGMPGPGLPVAAVQNGVEAGGGATALADVSFSAGASSSGASALAAALTQPVTSPQPVSSPQPAIEPQPVSPPHATTTATAATHGPAALPAPVTRPLTPQPLPAASLSPASDPTPPGTILCIGRLTRQKMQARLLTALARLHRAGRPARLLIVGAGPLERRLRAHAARLGLTGAVDFLGQRGDIPALMARAEVLALPSAFEGLPLVLLEAMATGLPAVATRIPGTIEALGPDHPWLVPPGRSRDMARALAQALDQPATRTQVARAQRDRFTARFTADRMADDTLRIYRAATAHHRKTAREDRMDHIRLGFIGAGGIAHRHFGVLETMPDVSVVAVTDPDAARADDAARRMGAQVFADADAMLAGAQLDAVYICIPPFAHGPAERACIAAGLPFFVEKPLSLDLALAEEIAAAVEAAGLITAVGYHWRYLDTMDEARARLADNPAHLMQGFWIDQTPPPEWWWRADRSGGQVVEQATHVIDAARFLAGDVTEVFGLAAHRDRGDFPGLTVPTATAATLRFASGAVANLGSTCLLRWNHRVGLHVFSDALALEITDHDLMIDTGHGRPVRHAEGDPVWREDRDFIEAVMGRDNRIRCPYAEALETHRVALAVARSAETGALVKMEALRSDPQPIFRQASA